MSKLIEGMGEQSHLVGLRQRRKFQLAAVPARWRGWWDMRPCRRAENRQGRKLLGQGLWFILEVTGDVEGFNRKWHDHICTGKSVYGQNTGRNLMGIKHSRGTSWTVSQQFRQGALCPTSSVTGRQGQEHSGEILDYLTGLFQYLVEWLRSRQCLI